MRFRIASSEKDSSAQQIGGSYEHLLFNRAMLSWLHIILGAAVGFIYLSTLDTSHLRWWRRGAGPAALMRCVLPLLPYVLSGLITRHLVTTKRLGLWIFSLILIVTTGAVGYFYLTRTSDVVTFVVVLTQLSFYLFAARLLLGDDFDE